MTREWDASSYHRLSDPQYRWGQKVLQRVSPRGDETVIDAGCGTARLTVELAQLLPRGLVVAVDLSQNMLAKARATISTASVRRNAVKPGAVGPGALAGAASDRTKTSGSAAALGRAPIQLVCADLAALPFISIADGVFSTAAFHWVKDHDAMFASILRSLKPGGWLIAQCGGGDNLLRLRQRTDQVMNEPDFREFFSGWNPPQNYQTDKETAARLKRIGFSDVACWLHNQDTRFADRETYRQFLATVTCHTHIARIPDPELRERFLDRLIALAQQEPELHLDYWRLNIQARKPY